MNGCTSANDAFWEMQVWRVYVVSYVCYTYAIRRWWGKRNCKQGLYLCCTCFVQCVTCCIVLHWIMCSVDYWGVAGHTLALQSAKLVARLNRRAKRHFFLVTDLTGQWWFTVRWRRSVVPFETVSKKIYTVYYIYSEKSIKMKIFCRKAE